MPKKELTVEEKLRLLYDLQLIDSKIDQIKSMQGELPVEIESLDTDITYMTDLIAQNNDELESLKTEITTQKTLIENSNSFIKKYSEQQKNVRNSREYNSITKEIEYQELEIQLAEKKIGKHQETVLQKEESLTVMNEKLANLKSLFENKNADLNLILSETSKNQEKLAAKSETYRNKIDSSLIKVYDKLRKSLKNGLAVVSIERGASAGSYIMIPPQMQLEVANRKKIITDEYSRRILVDKDLAMEETEKMQKELKL